MGIELEAPGGAPERPRQTLDGLEAHLRRAVVAWARTAPSIQEAQQLSERALVEFVGWAANNPQWIETWLREQLEMRTRREQPGSLVGLVEAAIAINESFNANARLSGQRLEGAQRDQWVRAGRGSDEPLGAGRAYTEWLIDTGVLVQLESSEGFRLSSEDAALITCDDRDPAGTFFTVASTAALLFPLYDSDRINVLVPHGHLIVAPFGLGHSQLAVTPGAPPALLELPDNEESAPMPSAEISQALTRWIEGSHSVRRASEMLALTAQAYAEWAMRERQWLATWMTEVGASPTPESHGLWGLVNAIDRLADLAQSGKSLPSIGDAYRAWLLEVGAIGRVDPRERAGAVIVGRQTPAATFAVLRDTSLLPLAGADRIDLLVRPGTTIRAPLGLGHCAVFRGPATTRLAAEPSAGSEIR